ncbi:MAG TPA: acylphosphatase [Planctomycetota bacterium]|nr:acylphosphatase [Planctomycetota bacterium]
MVEREHSASGGELQHLRVVYRGRVQGVGFRWTARSLADRHGIMGSVRNEPDGSVSIRAQGPPDAVDGFLKSIESAFDRHITSRKTYKMGELASYSSFEILR